MARLPQQGRWQMVDPRMTMGLFGGDPPPFGILTVDFQNLAGSTRWFMDQAPLSGVAVTGIDSFTARYALRGKAGAFKAKLRDDGELEMDFYVGPPVLKCRGVPRGHTVAAVRRMAILTCVGNPGWPTGPGHGALIADGNVHTFENPNLNGSTSGWLVMKTATYLGKQENLARPIVIQELNTSMVQTAKVMAYMDASTRADEDFVSSGWCSLQSAAALAEGITSGFEPAGLNTPLAVYQRAKALKLVTKEYYIWDTSKTPSQHVATLVQQLAANYYGVPLATPPDVRNW